MRISVALCLYNGEHFLAEQLASIGSQDRLPDELIVCDDGSSDNSVSLIEQFASTAPFPVRLVRNPTNLGVTRNFEQAIGLADGEIIVTADQDDVWYPKKLDRIEAEFRQLPGVGLVFSDADLIDGDGHSLGSRLWPSVRFGSPRVRQLNAGLSFRVLLRRPVITGATMAFRSNLRSLILPIPPSWIHDEWIGMMVASVGGIFAIDEPLMQYRRHGNNQVGVIGLDVKERARVSLAREQGAFLKRADDFVHLREAISDRIAERFDLLAEIDQKIAHYRVRGSLPRSRFRRIPTIFKELVSRRYSNYSGSSFSFARDLLAESL